MMRLQYDLLSNTLMINEQGTRVHACYLAPPPPQSHMLSNITYEICIYMPLWALGLWLVHRTSWTYIIRNGMGPVIE